MRKTQEVTDLVHKQLAAAGQNQQTPEGAKFTYVSSEWIKIVYSEIIGLAE
jgi:hypothetical protein